MRAHPRLSDLNDFRIRWVAGCNVLLDATFAAMWAISHDQGHPGVFCCWDTAFHLRECLDILVSERLTVLELENWHGLDGAIVRSGRLLP